jgi:cytochrome c553
MKQLVALAIAASLAGCSTAPLKADTAPNDVPPASSTASPGLSDAEILYGYRCKGCHEPATPGAPDRKALATYDESEIIDSLRKGPMKPLATGLTKDEIRELAAFLSAEHRTKHR